MIVAVTGVVLIAFVIGHLLGNLQIFLGPDWVNSYAEHLRELGPLLWVIRAFLLVNVLLHIFSRSAWRSKTGGPGRCVTKRRRT